MLSEMLKVPYECEMMMMMMMMMCHGYDNNDDDLSNASKRC